VKEWRQEVAFQQRSVEQLRTEIEREITRKLDDKSREMQPLLATLQ